MNNEEAARQISAALADWADRMRYIGETVPDFWDELNMPDRLGEWLAHFGVIATTRTQAELDGKWLCVVELIRHARLYSTGDETKAAIHIVVNYLERTLTRAVDEQEATDAE